MLTPDTIQLWQRGRAWRRLPYVKGMWAGPMGRTMYLADRDYRIIAYRDPAGTWRRGHGESLMGYPMICAGEYQWTPGRGSSPAVNAQTLADILARCASHAATVWIIEGAQHERA